MQGIYEIEELGLRAEEGTQEKRSEDRFIIPLPNPPFHIVESQ